MKDSKRFYTYAYLRKNNTPYYIGKGEKHRAYNKNHNNVYVPPKERVLFLKKGLLEEEAFKHEIYMISIFGRKDLGTGILHNKTNGGDGSSGRIATESQKKKQSEKMKGRKGPTISEEHRKKLSLSHMGIKKGPPSEKTKNKISKALKNKNQIPPSQKGTKWWNNGQINKRSIEYPGDEWILGIVSNVN
jgi:hypothetical protein